MALHKAYLGQLVLGTEAQAASNILAARELARAAAIIFYNPAAFTGTISVQVAPNEGAVAGDMKALDNNGTAVTLTAARAQRHEVNGFEALRIVTSGTEASERTVDVYAILTTDDR